MSISLVVAVTDNEWFEMLRHRTDLAEVNFWAPVLRAARSGDLVPEKSLEKPDVAALSWHNEQCFRG